MKKILPFLLVLGLFIQNIQAQNRAEIELKLSDRQHKTINQSRDGWLTFEANKTEGELPLTVKFSIKTQLEGKTFLWKFGDGKESTDESPWHTYYQEGLFSVYVKVIDVNDSIWEGYRSKYIKAGDPIKYDTLNYPLPGDFALYELNPPQSGYVAGNNSFLDSRKAEFFERKAGYFTIDNIWFDFAVAYNDTLIPDSLNIDSIVHFEMFSVNPDNGQPQSVVRSFYVDMDTVVRDVALDQATRLPVSPFDFKDDFFMSVTLPQLGDTLALWSNTDGDVDPGNAWEQWQDGSWHAMNADDSWQLNINLGVYVSQFHGPLSVPEQNNLPEFVAYPNPARDLLNVKWMKQPEEELEISLYSILGQKLMATSAPARSREPIQIRLGDYPEGVYLLRISDGEQQLTRKINIAR
jgi:hypothetical protein